MPEVKKVDKMPKDYINFTFLFLYYLFNYQDLKLGDPYIVSLVRIRVQDYAGYWFARCCERSCWHNCLEWNA
jgi:hypothetical protein